MKRLLLAVGILFSVVSSSQTRHVLLEEFTGAYCGQCPMGSYFVDSFLIMHPNLIAVSLHSYGAYDAMNFPEIDTIDAAYAQGAPLAAVDRICATPPSNNTAIYQTMWDAKIQQRLATPAQLTVDVNPVWNSSARLITANISVNILANLPAGDYRITLYVVEDSVVGSGPGYDQYSYYDQQPGPFYGLGNPIPNYVHRHVARALLPSPWGQSGIIPSSPTTGQVFTTTMNYTLPQSYDETQVHLIAVVNRVSPTHTNDEVMNANEVHLFDSLMAIRGTPVSTGLLYPNPANYILHVQFAYEQQNCTMEIIDVAGKVVLTKSFFTRSATYTINVADLPSGTYMIRATGSDGVFTSSFTHFQE